MLQITQADSAESAVRYLQNSLQIGDYYGSGERGVWRGLGAERLGLEGLEVKTEVFARLASNRLPDGKRLTVRDAEDRRPGTIVVCRSRSRFRYTWRLAKIR